MKTLTHRPTVCQLDLVRFRFVPYLDDRFAPYLNDRFAPYLDERFAPYLDNRFAPYLDDRFAPYLDERPAMAPTPMRYLAHTQPTSANASGSGAWTSSVKYGTINVSTLEIPK